MDNETWVVWSFEPGYTFSWVGDEEACREKARDRVRSGYEGPFYLGRVLTLERAEAGSMYLDWQPVKGQEAQLELELEGV